MPESKVVVSSSSPGGKTVVVSKVGGQGVKGEPGLSAYEVWLSLGNIGSKQDFIQSLRGIPEVFQFTQPSQVWVINHNLGYYPQVTVYSLAHVEVEADVINVSVNQVQVQFSQPFAGSAQLL